MTFQSNWKPSRTARKIAEALSTKQLQREERDSKAIVRRRDKLCRFPLCGCRKFDLRLEVSHDTHKAMGGNPKGDRSTPDLMVLLCTHRHQYGRVSRHAGTLRAVPHDLERGYNGPVAWYVNVDTLFTLGIGRPPHEIGVVTWPDGWVGARIASEVGIRRLEPQTDWQRSVCLLLAKMEA